MKIYPFSCDAQGFTDGVTTGQLIDHLPNRVSSLAQADVAVGIVVCHGGFKYNHAELNALRASGKPWVLIDYLEYGWDWNFDHPNTLISGARPCTHCDNSEWLIMPQFLRAYPPILEFKRELRNKDVTEQRIPIDFLAAHPKPPLVSLADYSSRPYAVTYVWGYSHPARAKMHGQIFQAMGEKNIDVLSSFEMLGGRSQTFDCPAWVSIFTPYWVREPMSKVLRVQEQGLISVCLPGAGFKCFREQEAPSGTVMAMQENDLARSYPWEHMVNALIMRKGQEFEDLYNFATLTPKTVLYEIYRRGQSTLDRYRRESYIPNYIIPNIESRL